MLALKKKREAEAKAAAEASTNPSSAPSSAGESTSSSIAANNDNANKVSLLGIGGKKKEKNGGGGTKKRTPGEIRIQKGEFLEMFDCRHQLSFSLWFQCIVAAKNVSATGPVNCIRAA
jgi:hypothetical protein